MFENTLDVTCSNISFIGLGKDKTTVHGGFHVLNKKNVTVKSLTLTNPNGSFGLEVLGKEASVEIMGVSIKECSRHGMFVGSGASVKATQCDILVRTDRLGMEDRKESTSPTVVFTTMEMKV